MEISGNTVIVGSDGANEWGIYSGSSYVSMQIGRKWVENSKIFSEVGAYSEYFINSVALLDSNYLFGSLCGGEVNG